MHDAFLPGNAKGYDLEARQTYMKKRSLGQKLDGPIIGKWFHGTVIEFLQNYKNGEGRKPYGGPGNKETDGFCYNLPLVCKFMDYENVDEISAEIIKTLSTYNIAVHHGMVASKIVSWLIREPNFDILSIRDKIKPENPEVSRSLDGTQLVIKENLDHTKAVNYVFGSPCYNPGSFQVSKPVAKLFRDVVLEKNSIFSRFKNLFFQISAPKKSIFLARLKNFDFFPAIECPCYRCSFCPCILVELFWQFVFFLGQLFR